MTVPPGQCQHADIVPKRKKRCMIFDSGMMTHEESLVLRWLKNGTLC